MANLSQDLVKRLYHKKRLSTLEIAQRLEVTPWKVIKFMIRRDLPRRTLKEANIERSRKQPLTFFLKQRLSLAEERLRIAGIMLYWGEGGKSNPEERVWTVDFANSDPRMIELFLKFLRQICGVDERRLRVFLYAYADQKIEALKRYWHNVTQIPLKQFTKPYIKKNFLLAKSGKMKYGLAHIRYYEKKLLVQIEDWINEYLQESGI